MKGKVMKRLLSGCLAAVLLFSDATGVLASNLSETVVETTELVEVVDSTEDTETTETTEKVDSTDGSEMTETSELVEDTGTETTESEETTEIVEETETEEATEDVEDTETEETTEVVETETEETTEVEEVTETEETVKIEEAPKKELEPVQTTVASNYTGPIYKAYFGLPSVLAPKVSEGTESDWSGHKIIGFGYKDASTWEARSYTDTWKILDPEKGLLWADGIFFTSTSTDMDSINSELDTYLNKVADNNTDVAKYDEIEKAAIHKMRILTKEEMMTEAYGFHNGTEANSARVMGANGRFYSYMLSDGESMLWVDSDGTISEYASSSTGCAPAVELNMEKVFMTIHSEFYEYGGYAKTDISSTASSRSWHLLLHSDDTGFTATLPTTAIYDGYYTIDVTGTESSKALSYDRVSIVFVDTDKNVVMYDNSDFEEGEISFSLPTELKPGTYTVKVFAENKDYYDTTGYVSNVVESTVKVVGPEITNVDISQGYGYVNLSWQLENVREVVGGISYKYFDILRADSKDGEYEPIAEDVQCYEYYDSYSWTDSTVEASDGTVQNKVYYYKIRYNADDDTSIESESVTNAELYYGETDYGGYKGAYVVDKDKNKITSLTIHEGEALELSIAFVKDDGTIEYIDSDDLGGARWYLHDGYAVGESYDDTDKEISKDKLGIYPSEVTTLEDGTAYIPSYQVYLQAEEEAVGTYYLTAVIYQNDGSGRHDRFWQIPITVVEAEENGNYGQRPDIAFTATQAESAQKLRDLMVARDYDSYFIALDGAELSAYMDFYDTYAEREGMKPYEGDYLFYQAGERNSVSSIYSDYETFSISFNGDYYTGYKMTTPFITTAEEEAQVDAKIKQLVHTEGGALYKYAYGDYTTEQKIRAIYDWIIANVNPSVDGDRTKPIYHTVWHTLFGAYGGYPGSGTCGAFAVLFTRLSREMGIPSKVIMGTDAAAHAYNIVEVGNKWYFIDTNSRRWLADEDNFTRAQEQSYYLDSRFIANYLGKVPGNDYYVESTGTAVVTDTDGTTSEEYGDLSKAVSYIMEQAAKEGNESVEYTITIKDGDMAFPETAIIFSKRDEDNYPIAHYDDRVTIDLGGNSLIIRDGLGASLAAKKVHNGVISIGDDAVLDLRNNADKTDSVYENLRIIYKSTQGAVDNTPELQIFAGFENKVILEDTVSLDELYRVELWNMIEINTDLSVKSFIQMQDGNKRDADDKITINGTLTVHGSCRVYAGIYEIEEFISKTETVFSAPAETTFIVGDKMTLAGYTGWAYDVGNFGEPGTIEVALKRQFATAEDTVPYKQATVNWSGSIFNYGLDYVTAPMFHFTAQDYVDGVLQENKVLPSGTTIGTVTAKGWNTSTGYYNVALTSTNLDQYLTVETDDNGKTFVELENGVLSVVSTSVTVKGPSGETKSFTSLKKAVDGLNTVSNSEAGDYFFTFAENTVLSSNITLPSYVKTVIFETAEVDEQEVNVSLDFNGKTLSTSASIKLNYHLKLINSADVAGKLTTSNTSNATAISFAGVNSGEENTEYILIDGVNISATNGTIRLGTITTAGKQKVESTITAKKLDIAGGDWIIDEIIVNNLEVCDKFESVSVGTMQVTPTLTAGTIKVTNGALTVQNGTTLTADTVSTVNGILHNYGDFICGTLTQDSRSKSFLYTGSMTVIEQAATLYTTQLAKAEGKEANPAFYRTQNAAVTFNTSFKRADESLVLDYAILAANDATDGKMYDTFADLTGQQVVFSSNIKTFPMECVNVKQASQNSRYNVLLQKGTNIVAANEWITIKTIGVNGTEEVLEKFITWKEASAYITTLSNATMTYVVEITEDLDLEEALTMPAKVAKVIFRGAGGENGQEAISLTYTGDLKLATETSFENINLSAQKYNGTTKTYDVYKSALNLAGKNLTFKNTTAEFASITGTTASVLTIIGNGNDKVTVYNAVKNLGTLDVANAELEIGSALAANAAAISGVKDVKLTSAEITVVNGTTALTGTLIMDDGVLDTNSKINLVNVISNSDKNRILYGGNAAGNILTITGTVTGDSTNEDTEQSEARVNPIDITAKALRDAQNSYQQNDLLLNAKKAAPAWFVVGSEYDQTGDRTDYASVTYKNGEKIYYGEKPNATVELQILYTGAAQPLTYGSYATLDEAFKEIDRLGDKTVDYYVYLSADTSSTSIPATITTPVNAKSVTVYTEAISPKTVYFNEKIVLKSNVVLQNIVLAPGKVSSTITLGDYSLKLQGTTIAENKKLGSITGSGVAKKSVLEFVDYANEFTISGNMTNIGTLVLNESKLTVEGTVTVGSVEVVSSGAATSVLTGTATVARNKSNVVTNVTPQITINGAVIGNLKLALNEKVTAEDKSVSYENIFEKADVMTYFTNNGVRLASAKNVSSEVFKAQSIGNASSSSVTLENSDTLLGDCLATKSGGYLVLQKEENVGGYISYTETAGKISRSYFSTFAEAVAEINNLKTKRDYTITLYDAMGEISLKKAAALTMPNKNYVNNLTIKSNAADGTPVNLHHTGNITLTSPTTLNGVYFKKAVVVGGVYAAVDDITKNSRDSAAYPAAISFSTGGYALKINGKVYFNTPVNFNGGSKGTLDITSGCQLATITNSKTPADLTEQLICGGITNFAEVTVAADQTLIISEYGVFQGAAKGNSYTAPTLNITTLTNAGEVSVVGTNKAGTVKITNANLDGGHLNSNGTLNITNMTLAGEVQVRAEKDFNITGTLLSTTDEAVFYTRQKAENNLVPYLSITAAVTLEKATDKIKVGVYVPSTVGNPESLVKLENAPKVSAQLLTAKTATAEMFVPVDTNVGGVGAYSAANTNGYILKKTGTAIHVYYGDEVAVALCKGNVDTGKLDTANVIAYYPTFKDAVDAINALRDKTAEYTIILLQDVNTKNENGTPVPAPAGITMPEWAANVIIASKENEVYDIYYTGNLTLKANTELVKVRLNPMNTSKAGVASNIAAGNFNLTLTDIEVANVTGMKINNITGTAKQVTTLATENFVVHGGVTGSKELVIEKPVTVKGAVKATTITMKNGTSEKANTVDVIGTFTADDLVMEGYTVVNAGNTITIKNIYNNKTEELDGTQKNTINYKINGSGAPLLKITGLVSGDNTSGVIFNLSSTGTTKMDYQLKMDATKPKYVLSDKQKLAAVEKAALSEIDFQLNGVALSAEEVVKANKGVYIIDTSADSKAYINSVRVSYDAGMKITYCLDYSQAVNEINTLADANAKYTIRLGRADKAVTDTNLLDDSKTSGITMPKANVAALLNVVSENLGRVQFAYSGHISYSGKLVISNLELAPTADCNITVTKSKTDASLTMMNVTTTADKNWSDGKPEATGFIGTIKGTRNVTDVTLTGVNLRVKGAISDVNKLSLNKFDMNYEQIIKDTSLITTNTVTVNKVAVNGAATWHAIGKTTITDLDVSGATDGYFIATKQTATSLLPMFTINGTVTLKNAGTPSVWKVMKPETTATNIVLLTESEQNGKSLYADTSLVVAPKEDADKFVAYPFAAANIGAGIGGITAANLVYYKTTKNEVVNGSKDDMTVRITQTHEGEAGQQVTYAKSFDEAVTIINNLADTTADYRMELLKGDIVNPLKTTKNGTAYGAMTLPSKANSVTITSGITGMTPDPDNEEQEIPYTDSVVIFYTGTLQPKCDTRFEHVALTEGKVANGTFTPTYTITPSYTGAYELSFAESVQTVWQEGDPERVNSTDLLIKLATVSIPKGKLTLEGAAVKAVGSLNVKDLEMTAGTTLTTEAAATITNLTIAKAATAVEEPATITSKKALTITNISGAGNGNYNGTLYLKNYFTTTAKATADSVTQLAINGTVTDVDVVLAPYVYSFNAKAYHEMNQTEAAALLVTGGKPTAKQKLATMPKGMTDDVRVAYYDGTVWQTISGNLFKQAGALYVTNEPLLVKVIGTSEAGRKVYEAEFLTWDQAVNEINKRADKTVTYEMILQGNIGGAYGSEAPLGTITMPTSAKEVIVTSEAGENYHMMFTGTTLTIRSNTTFKDVGLFAVKKVVKNRVTTYQSVNYNMNTGNFALTMENMTKTESNVYVSQLENLSGAAKGSFTFVQGDGANTVTSPARKISNVGTVNLYNADKVEIVEENISESTYEVYNGISGVTTLNVYPGVTLESANGALNVKNLNAAGATVAAKNITVSLDTTLESARLEAGSTAANDGKMSLKAIILEDTENYLSAEQDRNGKTQITITGTVTGSENYDGDTGESAIEVDLYYNNFTSHAQVYDGMALLNAQKAASSWFKPFYTVEDIEEDIYMEGMGYETENYGVYKSGKEIRYGYLSDMEVELIMLETTEFTYAPKTVTYFATFEEAVKEIDSLALYKEGTKTFTDYRINLLNEDVQIGNTKGDNRYSAMSLPAKAGNVEICGGGRNAGIRFSGNITLRCNVEFFNVRLEPVKLSGKEVVPAKTNIAVGNYTLTLNEAEITEETGETLVGNITGSSKSGTLRIMGTNSGDSPYVIKAGNVTGLKEINLVNNAVLDAAGNINVYQLRFTEYVSDTTAEVHADGTFTTNLIYKEGEGNVILGKGAGKAMNINGAQLDLDGDKKKENYTVFYSHPEEENEGRIWVQVQGTDKVAGTKVLTSKYLNEEDYTCIDEAGNEYNSYVNGTNLILGKKIA